MKRIITVLLAICYNITSYGQLFESKSELFVAYTTGNFVGGQMFNDHGTIAPSFYRNLQSVQGITFGANYKLSDFYSAVFSVEQSGYTSWSSTDYSSYKNTQLMSLHLCPAIQYHSAFRDHGLYNRLKLYANACPVITLSTIAYPVKILNALTLDQTYELSYGARVTIGAEYAISNKIGLFFNSSLQQSFVKSHTYIDTNYLYHNINIGICLSIITSKTFNY